VSRPHGMLPAGARAAGSLYAGSPLAGRYDVIDLLLVRSNFIFSGSGISILSHAAPTSELE